MKRSIPTIAFVGMTGKSVPNRAVADARHRLQMRDFIAPLVYRHRGGRDHESLSVDKQPVCVTPIQ